MTGLGRSRRLRKGAEFEEAYQQGAVTSGPLLVFRHRPNGGPVSRWGFAVGRRVAKRAVDRNRARRRLKTLAAGLPLAAGYDVIVTARASALGASFTQLDAELRRLAKRAGLLLEAPEQ